MMLSDAFFTPGAPATFQTHAGAGSARVAVGEERPALSALGRVQAEMQADARVHAARLARSEHALLQAQQAGATAAAELARLTAVAAAQAAPNTPVSPPAAPTAPTVLGSDITITSILTAEGRAAVTPLRRDDARRLVASLEPSSPLSTMQSLARAADLTEVRLGCGPPSNGSSVNRTKAHVLADMRVAVGLSPVAVPMGLPIETGGGITASDHFPSHAKMELTAPPPPTPPLPPLPPLPTTENSNLQADFGLVGFDARGGAGITGEQIVADACGEPATRYIVHLADGTTMQALCPLAGPFTTVMPPPGAIYLGVDVSKTRVWATTDGRVICTPAKPIATNVAADVLPPPPPPKAWFSRRTVCCAAMAFLAHLLVLGVAVGWAAGRPSTGMGFIVGLPTAAHEAGALARRINDFFSPMSIAHTVLKLSTVAMGSLGYIGTWSLRCCCLPATLLYRAATCVPAQRLTSCQECVLMLVAATLRSIIHTVWTFGVGAMLAALSYLAGGSLGAAACIMVPCITTWTTYVTLSAIPSVVHSFLGRLRRARGRVSPLIPPGSPPPWDTSTIYNRHRDYLHRPHWEGRFAGARRTCRERLVSAAANWHLPWWLLMLALQWMVVAILDVGARRLNYRVSTRSHRETLPLLGEETPLAASAAAMGRWTMRWLQRSYAGARRHLSRSLRTLASSLLISRHLPPLPPALPWCLWRHPRRSRMAYTMASDHIAIAIPRWACAPQASHRLDAGNLFTRLASTRKRGSPVLSPAHSPPTVDWMVQEHLVGSYSWASYPSYLPHYSGNTGWATRSDRGTAAARRASTPRDERRRRRRRHSRSHRTVRSQPPVRRTAPDEHAAPLGFSGTIATRSASGLRPESASPRQDQSQGEGVTRPPRLLRIVITELLVNAPPRHPLAASGDRQRLHLARTQLPDGPHQLRPLRGRHRRRQRAQGDVCLQGRLAAPGPGFKWKGIPHRATRCALLPFIRRHPHLSGPAVVRFRHRHPLPRHASPPVHQIQVERQSHSHCRSAVTVGSTCGM